MNRRNHFSGIFLAFIMLVGRSAYADAPFAVDPWGTADGLKQSSVISLTQTRDGYLWAGTQNGLARFDGNSFTTFNVNNTPSLPDNVIIFLFEDRATNFWAVTGNGFLCLIQNGVVKKFNVSGANGKITAAVDDAAGAVWFATDGGDYFHWQTNVLEHVSGIRNPDLTDLALHGRWQNSDGSYWLLRNSHAVKWRNGAMIKKFSAEPWGGAFVTALCEDAAGNLVIGTRGAGIFWSDADGNFTQLTTTNGLSKNFVLSLWFDDEKNLWVGTDGGGLNRVRRKNFIAPAELGGGVAQSAAEDANGGIWTAFNLQGVIYWRTNSPQAFSVGRENKAWCVLADQRGGVWTGTSGEGLYRLVDGKFEPVTEAARIGQKVFALMEKKSGELLAGGDAGLGMFDGLQWKFFDGLPKTDGVALAEDTNGVVWIGTKSDGLFQLRDGQISPAEAPVKDVSALHISMDGALWAGTFAHGLARRSAAGEWKTFSSTANGLANDDIGFLTGDEAGNLWIGSYEGLARVEANSIASVISGAVKNLSCRTFLTTECSSGAQPATLRARDGKLWFPTTEGLVSVNPSDLRINTNPPPVIIESITVDGVELKTNLLASGWSGTVKLVPQNEQLEIRFTALNFSAPKGAQFGARFKYQLEGRDNHWTDLRTDRVVTLNRLEAGEYIFHVKACNEDGVWNQIGASVVITVEPPFWKKKSFMLAMFFFTIAAIGAVIYLVSTAKLKRQLRAARQKEIIERERARIARDLHDQLGANLTQITLLGEMAELDKEQPKEIEEHAKQICDTARETTRSLDEIVWAVNPSNDTLEGLANYACKYAQDYFALAGVSYRAELPANLPATPILPEVRHNVFLAFKEAVNNVVKHSQATEAHVKLELKPDEFVLSVTDNGRGVGDISGKSLRNGLKNMKRRLADVRGEFQIIPGLAGGTTVNLRVPRAKPKATGTP